MSTDVKPTKPWAASPRDRVMTALSVVIAIVISFSVVAATPMKGKLAYTFVFFVAWIAIDSFFAFNRLGVKGVRNGFAEKLTLIGALIVSAAVASILWTTIYKGFKGLNLAFVTQTMREASIFDPIGKGGILHSIVGTLMLIALSIIFSVPMGI
jgi:phosphate transport system permease protein